VSLLWFSLSFFQQMPLVLIGFVVGARAAPSSFFLGRAFGPSEEDGPKQMVLLFTDLG
jgi:hypothetical protein